jgi:hypothetical protein
MEAARKAPAQAPGLPGGLRSLGSRRATSQINALGYSAFRRHEKAPAFGGAGARGLGLMGGGEGQGPHPHNICVSRPHASWQKSRSKGDGPKPFGCSPTATSKVAADLGISDNTVRNRVRNASKLAARRRRTMRSAGAAAPADSVGAGHGIVAAEPRRLTPRTGTGACGPRRGLQSGWGRRG